MQNIESGQALIEWLVIALICAGMGAFCISDNFFKNKIFVKFLEAEASMQNNFPVFVACESANLLGDWQCIY